LITFHLMVGGIVFALGFLPFTNMEDCKAAALNLSKVFDGEPEEIELSCEDARTAHTWSYIVPGRAKP
jgi:hypothetical protein